jgi:ribokinase
VGAVVVVGSMNMDISAAVPRLPACGETILARGININPGGKGANQAVAAARLGAQVSLIGRVGNDSYGASLLESLKESEVDVNLVVRDEELPTGMALINVAQGGANTIVVYPGANGGCVPADIESADDAISGASAMILQLEIPMNVVEAGLVRGKERGLITILNPAPARAIPESVLKLVDVLVPNESEAELLTGIKVESCEDALRCGRKLREKGPCHVITTLGDKGAAYVGPGQEMIIPAFEVDAVDSTGAGDTFVGALAVAMIEGMDPRAATRFACAAGGLTASKQGAMSAIPCRADVDSMLA